VVAHYLCLGPDSIRENLAQVADANVGFIPHRPPTLGAAQAALRSGSVQLVVAELGVAALELQGSWPAAAVFGAPTLILSPRALDEDEIEALRLRGASHVLNLPIDRVRDLAAMHALARAGSWMAASVNRFPLADLLQTMASHAQSGMLYVTTGSATLISGMGDADAHGYGRIYMVDGQLVHAETGTGAVGAPAVAEILALPDATFCVHEVFITPRTRSINASLTTVLLHAAWCSDESVRLGEEKRSLPPPTSWKPPEAAPTGEEAPPAPIIINPSKEPGGVMSKIESLLKAVPEVRLAATADRAGNVTEASGAGDAESLCAAVALSRSALERAGELMGLGPTTGYTAASDKLTVFVHERPDGFLAALGDSSRNADSTSRKIVDRVK
jgi:hypothetical protein